MIIVHLSLQLLTVNILNQKRCAAESFPLDPENDWMSVQRHLNAPDTIHFTKCPSPFSICSTIPDSSAIRSQNFGSAANQCSCQCKADAAAFLPSVRSCINKLG
ncbi:unnamed protein product [Gongylonema pulchrum]|uniref:Secreted protein n=1 Tax=Gongylonema pulchrum TaxID=637853 RepID=A0A183EZZ8_9BILA|nr:unnamed protein product [Gongylonema pulchrum]